MSSKYDRHIFLYAKYHYKRSSTIEDMKVIVGRRCMLFPDQVSINNICQILMGIVCDYIDPYNLTDFVFDLSPDNYWKSSPSRDEYDFSSALIYKCLSVLRHQKVKDIPFDLGKPDPTILPLKEESIENVL